MSRCGLAEGAVRLMVVTVHPAVDRALRGRQGFKRLYVVERLGVQRQVASLAS